MGVAGLADLRAAAIRPDPELEVPGAPTAAPLVDAEGMSLS